MIKFKGSHFEREVILWGVRWYVAYPISYRQLEEIMRERGVEFDHATLNRWVLRYVALLDEQFRIRKRPVGSSWRMDETYIKVKGACKYLYRADDKPPCHCGLPYDCQTRPRVCSTVFAQSDQLRWHAKEDHSRQERREHSGD
jgi:hypothetical protein